MVLTNAVVLDAVRQIVTLEQRRDGDSFAEAETIALTRIKSINLAGLSVEPLLYRFLDDLDIRRRDPQYAQFQTEAVLKFLDAT